MLPWLLAFASSPGVYNVSIETEGPDGSFTIEVHEEWAPVAAARFRELVEVRAAHISSRRRRPRVAPGLSRAPARHCGTHTRVRTAPHDPPKALAAHQPPLPPQL